jgi:hypothetical protein
MLFCVERIERNTREKRVLVGETTGGGFETLGGDKTHCFITRTRSLQTHRSLQYTPSLFSLVFLSILSHT